MPDPEIHSPLWQILIERERIRKLRKWPTDVMPRCRPWTKALIETPSSPPVETPEARARDLAACSARAWLQDVPRSKRAQGRPGIDRYPWSACRKKARGRTTGSAKYPAFPARWIDGLYALSPVPGLVGHRRHTDHHQRGLASASGCQDHTTSPSAVRQSSRKSAWPTTATAYPPHVSWRCAYVPLDEAGWQGWNIRFGCSVKN